MVGTIEVSRCYIVDVHKYEIFLIHIYFMDPYLNRDLKKKIYIKFMEGNNRSQFILIFLWYIYIFKIKYFLYIYDGKIEIYHCGHVDGNTFFIFCLHLFLMDP